MLVGGKGWRTQNKSKVSCDFGLTMYLPFFPSFLLCKRKEICIHCGFRGYSFYTARLFTFLSGTGEGCQEIL